MDVEHRGRHHHQEWNRQRNDERAQPSIGASAFFSSNSVRKITGESKDPFGMIKVGTSATTKISRKEFGLVWNTMLETGGVAVGDEVKIALDLQFQRKP